MTGRQKGREIHEGKRRGKEINQAGGRHAGNVEGWKRGEVNTREHGNTSNRVNFKERSGERTRAREKNNKDDDMRLCHRLLLFFFWAATFSSGS